MSVSIVCVAIIRILSCCFDGAYFIIIMISPQGQGDMEVPQFSPRLPNPSDPPRGIEETPTVGVLATASLLRTFQPQPGDTVFAVIVAAFGRFVRRSRTSSKHFRRHMYSRCMALSCVAVARAQTLGVHYKNPKRNFHLSQSGNRHFALCLQEHDRFHARRIGEPPTRRRSRQTVHCPRSSCA